MYTLNYTPTTLGVQSWREIIFGVREQKVEYHCSRLCTVTRMISSYYGFPILLSVSLLFMSTVLVLYSILCFTIYSSYTDSILERYVNLSQSIWYYIYCGILMIIITMSCHLVGSETDNIMLHIEMLLLHHDLRNETEKELKQFCFQLNCLKLNSRFVVYLR
jgi:hypothetical protein